MRSPATPKGRNVKSAQTTDGHERAKDFLSATEVAKLHEAMKQCRHGIRDHLLVLMMFRQGLRVSEAIGIRRNEVDLDHARLWVRRLKRGLDVEHPVAGDELRAIKALPRPFAPTRFPGSSSPNARSRLRGKP
jgi:type 1 fimbriae regulatory protein FimB